MYDFNGEFRTKPQQNLSGSSNKLSREALIQKTQEERRKRELSRKQTKAAITIQSHVRTFLVNRRIARTLRIQFDQDAIVLSNQTEFDFEKTQLLWRNLCIFYDTVQDADRLNLLAQNATYNYERILSQIKGNENLFTHRLCQLIQLAIRQLSLCIRNGKQHNLATTLNLVQIFTSPASYRHTYLDTNVFLTPIWLNLIFHGYFTHLRVIFEYKVPEPNEETTKSSTQASSLLELILRPLTLQSTQPEYGQKVVSSFFNVFLRGPLTPQVELYFLPATAYQLPWWLKCDQLFAAFPIKEEETFPLTVWTLFALVKIVLPQLAHLSQDTRLQYLRALRCLISTLPERERQDNIDSDEEDIQPFARASSAEIAQKEASRVGVETINILNSAQHVTGLLLLAKLCGEEHTNSNELLASFSLICYQMLLSHDLDVHKYRLLYTLAFNPAFLRKLWFYVLSAKGVDAGDQGAALVQVISVGTPIAIHDWPRILPQLTLFAALFDYLLPTNDDIEFHEQRSLDQLKRSTLPFLLDELRNMVITLRELCLGLIELAYRDTKPLTDDYKKAITRTYAYNEEIRPTCELERSSAQWLALFKVSIKLLRQLHNRDSRKQFCPSGHWISRKVQVPIDKPVNFKISEQQKLRYQPFVGLKKLSKQELEELGPPMSITEIRNITILQEIPFVIPFTDRVQILQLMITKDKEEHHGNSNHFLSPNSTIDVVIRRNYIYEDAFKRLSVEQEPDIKKHIRVQMINEIGLGEAGIDGGGIFREFLSQLIKTAFDPNRGFFIATADNFLYPNSCADLIHENYLSHYFFIGRILGKAIYENMLTELPFSLFFLAKMLDKHSGSNIDIHHLASLDPLMYKNLVYLKNYEGDVAELDLDFTVVNSDFGQTRTIELKPNGANIPVTASNRIEYIHLVADYRLNRKIRAHCSAFKRGMANCIDLDWLRMFSPRELRTLICGAQVPIDLNDLRSNCVYSGGYTADHPTIKAFWLAIEVFDETQKRKLLKFVTSCSRPPLLGFRHLEPPFTIQYAGKENRLPTASTCMNLLKLPEFHDSQVIREKIIYAIEAEVGFELS